MKRVASDTHGAVLRAVRAVLAADPALAGLVAVGPQDRKMPTIVVESLSTESWASATFDGHRHRLDLALRGDPVLVDRVRRRLHACLVERELPLRGRCVIDSSLSDATTECDGDEEVCRLRFEVLTLED